MLPMNKVVEASAHIELDSAEQNDLDAFIGGVVEKYPHVDAGQLSIGISNQSKYYKAVGEAHTGMNAADIDIFRDISNIVTAKFYVGSVMNELASVQTLDNVFGYIYKLTFRYGDDDAASGVTAGDALSAVRTSGYASDQGENTIPRRLSADLKQTLVEAVLRPLDLSSSFQAVLRRASVLKGNAGAFNNQFLNAAYGKLRDELEVGALVKIAAAVPAAHKEDFAAPTATDCTEIECEKSLIFEAMGAASRKVYDATGYYPNVAITGPQGLALMEKYLKVPAQEVAMGLRPQRGKIGVFGKRWLVYYDPSVTSKILLGAFDPENPMNNPMVYAPYITLAVTPEIYARDLSSSQVVFAVDRVDITEAELFGQVTIL